MIQAYSQRLLPPYSGVVQIAESNNARAQSFDGVNWEIQFLGGNEQTSGQPPRPRGYALDQRNFKVASIHQQKLKPYILPSCLDAAQVTGCIHELSDFIASASLPFAAADSYEYWLLDSTDDSPLALIFSCCEESQMSAFPARSEWTALPHSKMKVVNTDAERERHAAPVNDRLQRMVTSRAGSRPRAAWFDRTQQTPQGFPSLLVREDWRNEAEHELCQRYLMRKAPRLLMLQGLAQADRERLEAAAKKHALEVDEYYPLYPEVVNQRRMAAIRVEARLRRTTPQNARVDHADKSDGAKPLSKDLRILE